VLACFVHTLKKKKKTQRKAIQNYKAGGRVRELTNQPVNSGVSRRGPRPSYDDFLLSVKGRVSYTKCHFQTAHTDKAPLHTTMKNKESTTHKRPQPDRITKKSGVVRHTPVLKEKLLPLLSVPVLVGQLRRAGEIGLFLHATQPRRDPSPGPRLWLGGRALRLLQWLGGAAAFRRALFAGRELSASSLPTAHGLRTEAFQITALRSRRGLLSGSVPRRDVFHSGSNIEKEEPLLFGSLLVMIGPGGISVLSAGPVRRRRSRRRWGTGAALCPGATASGARLAGSTRTSLRARRAPLAPSTAVLLRPCDRESTRRSPSPRGRRRPCSSSALFVCRPRPPFRLVTRRVLPRSSRALVRPCFAAEGTVGMVLFVELNVAARRAIRAVFPSAGAVFRGRRALRRAADGPPSGVGSSSCPAFARGACLGASGLRRPAKRERESRASTSSHYDPRKSDWTRRVAVGSLPYVHSAFSPAELNRSARNYEAAARHVGT